MTARGKENPSYLHGMSNTPEHRAWQNMIGRCYNKNHGAYRNYGLRGVAVCGRWLASFEAFLADMGPRPSRNHSLDREDNSGNYEPDNCRWATEEEQRNNKRSSRRIVYRGEEMTVAQALRRANSSLSFPAVSYRLAAGWPVDHAIEAPKYARPSP